MKIEYKKFGRVKISSYIYYVIMRKDKYKMKVKSRKEILELFAQLGYNVKFGKHYRDMGYYNEIRNISDALMLFSQLGYQVKYKK